MADGLSTRSAEQEGVYNLVYAAQLSDDAIFRALLVKPWLLDDVTWLETRAIFQMEYIARTDTATALKLLEMPFMETVELMDLLALSSLREVGEAGYLDSVLAHPSLHDGITDDRTNVIAALRTALSRRPELALTMVDPEQTVVAERSVTLPLTGDISLSVIWPAHGATPAKTSHTLDLLEDTVRAHARFMGTAYPQPYAIVLVADVGERHGGGGGSSFVSIHPSWYDDPELMAHEVAHTYWKSSPAWIAEGAASFMDTAYVSDKADTPLPPAQSCAPFSSISDLVDSNPAWGDICNYVLGEGLFLELYGALGDATFRQAFETLFTWLDDEALRVRCITKPKGLCYVHAAFIEGLPEHSDVTEEIIYRLYFGDKPVTYP